MNPQEAKPDYRARYALTALGAFSMLPGLTVMATLAAGRKLPDWLSFLLVMTDLYAWIVLGVVAVVLSVRKSSHRKLAWMFFVVSTVVNLFFLFTPVARP